MKFKSNLINEIFRLEEDIRYETSFNFIYDQLQPFRSYLFYLPSVTPVNLALELQFEKKHYSDPEIDKTVYKLQSILYQGTNILQLDDESTFYTTFTYDQLIEELSLKLCVPKIRLTLSSNYEDDVEIIRKPVYYKLDIN
jgi:hypothetical protein